MVAFLTLPQRCSPEWPAEALATWALTLGPAARPHVGEGRRRAVAAGATGQQPLVAATCHAMLSLTLGGRRGRLPGLDEGRLATAYAVLESSLPRAVVAALPPRVSSADRAMRRLGWLSVPLGAGAVLALGQGGELLTELFG